MSQTGTTAMGQMVFEVDVQAKQTQGKRVEGRVRSHTLLVDQPEQRGGNDAAPTPPEVYAFSLAACIVSALRFIAELEGVAVSNIQAGVRGSMRFNMDIWPELETRPGFQGLEMNISFDSPMSGEEKQAFLDHVLERCPVCDNTRDATPFRAVLAR